MRSTGSWLALALVLAFSLQVASAQQQKDSPTSEPDGGSPDVGVTEPPDEELIRDLQLLEELDTLKELEILEELSSSDPE